MGRTRWREKPSWVRLICTQHTRTQAHAHGNVRSNRWMSCQFWRNPSRTNSISSRNLFKCSSKLAYSTDRVFMWACVILTIPWRLFCFSWKPLAGQDTQCCDQVCTITHSNRSLFVQYWWLGSNAAKQTISNWIEYKCLMKWHWTVNGRLNVYIYIHSSCKFRFPIIFVIVRCSVAAAIASLFFLLIGGNIARAYVCVCVRAYAAIELTRLSTDLSKTKHTRSNLRFAFIGLTVWLVHMSMQQISFKHFITNITFKSIRYTCSARETPARERVPTKRPQLGPAAR